MRNIIFDAPRTFTVELSEVATYRVEITANSTLDLMEQIHAIDEQGDFDPNESTVNVSERTVDSVLDATGKPIDYVAPEEVKDSPIAATEDPLYAERRGAAEAIFIAHDFPTPVRNALTEWQRTGPDEWQRTYGLERDSGNPDVPPIPSTLIIRFHPGTTQVAKSSDVTHYPVP